MLRCKDIIVEEVAELSRLESEGSGDVVAGDWTMAVADPVTIALMLNRVEYGEVLLLNP